MILVCNSCGETYPGGGACDLHCGGRPARYSVGDPCGEVSGFDGDLVCDGTLVEAVVLPKTVADGIERVRAALRPEGCAGWDSSSRWARSIRLVPSMGAFAAHLRSLLEKAP